MSRAVFDTNVLLVANGQHDKLEGTPCQDACLKAIERIQRGQDKLVIDEDAEGQSWIIEEYLHKTKPWNSQLPGDQLLRRILTERYSGFVDIVAITPRGTEKEPNTHAPLDFHEFPQDPLLVKFDVPDRKMVAAAIASKSSVKVAADAGFLKHQEALSPYVSVDFLCPDEIKLFRRAQGS